MSESRSGRRIAGVMAKLSLLLFGVAVSMLMVEGIVRGFFEEPILPRYVIDAGYGVRANQPNVTTVHSVPGDYKVTINTNSAGMRGTKEYSLEKPAGVYRIALIGDSFVFGFGVNDDEVVSHVIETQMNSRALSGRRYEVLNFGVSGFGQAEELVTYREKVNAYNPDAVVLFYFDNDIGNSKVSGLFELDDNGILVRTGKSYLPGVKIRERMYSIAPIRWLFEYSQAWNLIRNRLSSLVQKSLLKKQGLKSFSDTDESASELTKSLLQVFAKEIQSNNAYPVLFLIPHKNLKSNFPMEMSLVRNSGWDFIDGRGFLSLDDYYARDSHWRVSGHKKAADVLMSSFFDWGGL